MDGILDGYFKEEFAEARKKSLIEGEAIGVAKGEAIGVAKGELKKTIQFIRRQMKKGMTFDEACTYLDLTEEEIRGEVRRYFETET